MSITVDSIIRSSLDIADIASIFRATIVTPIVLINDLSSIVRA